MKLLWALFTAIGSLFLALGILSAVISERFFADAVRTEGEVVDVRFNQRGSGAPDVAYTDARGRAHVFRSTTYSSPAYRVGDRVTIAHDPDDPREADIDSWSGRWLLPTIFCALGGIQFTLGVGALLRRARRKRDIAELLRHGHRVDATILRAEQDTRIRVNRQHPYVLHCQATLPGEKTPRTFLSRRFWYDPTGELGSTVSVYYDPNDPSRHVVDTGKLPTRRR